LGTRTIAAIRLDLDHDPRCYNGPPYAIVKHVFDEDGMIACEVASEERIFDDSGKLRIVTVVRNSTSGFARIRSIDDTVVLVRDMAAMRTFNAEVLGFDLIRELSPNWVEYRVGDNVLALAKSRLTAADAPKLSGSASLQLAFRVPPSPMSMAAPTNSHEGASICCRADRPELRASHLVVPRSRRQSARSPMSRRVRRPEPTIQRRPGSIAGSPLWISAIIRPPLVPRPHSAHISWRQPPG
jgi:hypothetical protein